MNELGGQQPTLAFDEFGLRTTILSVRTPRMTSDDP